MYISSINYVGPSSVKVLSTTYYNESYELFEFSEEESQYWRKLVIYGNLINFIIPPNGTLEIKYEALKTMNITEYDFEEYGLGVVQSSNYTMNVSIQYTPRIIRCTKGVAEITITLIYVEIPVGGHLQIKGQNQSIAYNNGIFTNETIVFNSNELTVYYFLNGQTSTGLLLLYEGQYITIPEEKAIWQEAWFWILFGIFILSLFVIVVLGCYCYYLRDKKDASRRFEFLLSIIKRQNQLSNEDVVEFEEISDALLIEEERLMIHHDRPLGTGVCSTVYRGFLSGLAPLAKLSYLVETQKFRDCEVAVKHALHFGNHEVNSCFERLKL